MASNGSVNSGGYQGRVLQVNWNTVRTSGNTRIISYSVTAVGGQVSIYYHHNDYVNINGTRVYTGSNSHAVKTGTVLASGEMEINQNVAVNLTVEMHGGIYYYSDNINTTQSWELDNIIVAPTIYNAYSLGETETSVTIGAYFTKADNWYYKLSSSQNYIQGGTSGVTSANFTINNLQPNTTYVVNFKARNWISESTHADSDFDVWVTTYDYPKPLSINDFTIGEGATVKMYNPLGRTYHLALIGNNNIVIGQYDGDYAGEVNAEFKTPTAINYQYQSIPNSKSGKYYASVTYNNSNHRYSSSKTYRIKDDGTEIPTFEDFTYRDVNNTTLSLTGNQDIIIDRYSTVEANVSVANKASGNLYATMEGYRLSIGDKITDIAPWSENENVSMSISNINSNTLIVSAIDSRGLAKNVEKTISDSNYKKYTDIRLNTISATRAGGGAGTEVSLTYNGRIWNSSFGTITNSITSVKYYYKITGTSDETYVLGNTQLNPDVSGYNFSETITIQGDLAGQGFDEDNSYTIKVVVNDELSSSSKTVIIPVGKPTIALHKNGIAIGKKYDTTEGGILQIGGQLGVSARRAFNKVLVGPVQGHETGDIWIDSTWRQIGEFKRLVIIVSDTVYNSIASFYFEYEQLVKTNPTEHNIYDDSRNSNVYSNMSMIGTNTPCSLYLLPRRDIGLYYIHLTINSDVASNCVIYKVFIEY